MSRIELGVALVATLASFASLPSPAVADDAQVARGRFLVTIAGC